MQKNSFVINTLCAEKGCSILCITLTNLDIFYCFDMNHPDTPFYLKIGNLFHIIRAAENCDAITVQIKRVSSFLHNNLTNCHILPSSIKKLCETISTMKVHLT